MDRILIIDDHPLLRRGARQVLAEEFDGAVVEEASAAEALPAVRQHDWKVVVLGVSGAGIAALDLLNQIRAAAPAAPVVLLTPESDGQAGVVALRLGAAGAVSKSAPAEELGQAVRLAMLGRRYVSSAIAELLVSEMDGSAKTAPHKALSPSEHTVLCALVSGKSVADIARSLDRSPKTVSTFRTRIFRKLRVKTTVELVHYAMRHNLLSREAL